MKANLSRLRQLFIALPFTLTIAITLTGNSAFAGDPFRKDSSRDIGEKTEAAFKAIFQKGNYQEAKRYLKEAESSQSQEPLTYAIAASLAYTEKDWQTLNNYALKTLQAAQSLKAQDPLRSNLYTAVGNALEAAYIFQKEGAIGAITKLQQVFQYFDAAEKTSPNDPELNLIKGYLDLVLAVNLPFSTPEQAIKRFEQYGAPDYLVDRGLALAYRDLKQYDKALEFVNLALKVTPENPEVYYLKGQILRQKGKKTENVPLLKQALENFDQALANSEIIPKSVLKTLKRERRKTQEKIDELIQSAKF